MSEIVRVFMTESARRRIEPYFGFISSIHEGIVHCDLDFVAIASLRLWIHALNAVDAVTSSSSSQLAELSLQLGVNKHLLHPPVGSNGLVPYQKLASRFRAHSTDLMIAPSSSSSTSDGKATVVHGGSSASLVGRLLTGVAACLRFYSTSLKILRLRGFRLSQGGTSRAEMPATSAAGVARLCLALPFALHLTHIDFSDTQLGDLSVIRIAGSIAQLPLLADVSFAGCALTEASANALALLITASVGKLSSTTFRSNLRGGGGGGGGDEKRTTPSSNGLGLHTLTLSRNLLSDKFAAALSDALRHDDSLVSLALDNNAITVKGVETLLRSLTTERGCASRLRFLNLSSNSYNGGTDLSVRLQPLVAGLRQRFQVIVSEADGNHQLILSAAVVRQASSQEEYTAADGGVLEGQHQTRRRSKPAPLPHRTVSSTAQPSRSPSPPQQHLTQNELRPPTAANGHVNVQQEEVQNEGARCTHCCSTTKYTNYTPQNADPSPPYCNSSTSPMPALASMSGAFGYIPIVFAPHLFGSGGYPFPTAAAPPVNGAGAAATARIPRAEAETQTNGCGQENEATEERLIGKEQQQQQPISVDELLEEHLLTDHQDKDAADVAAVLEKDNDGAAASPTASPQLILSQLHHLVTEMLAAQEDRTSMSIESIKGDVAATNRRVEDMSSMLHSALVTVQEASHQLDSERRAFERAEVERQEWLEANPQVAMEQDVVALIHAGIDKIKTQMMGNNSGAKTSSSNANQMPSAKPLNAASTSSSALSSLKPALAQGPQSVPNTARPSAAKENNDSNQNGSSPPPQQASTDFVGKVKHRLALMGW